jgi:hypothetical protein
VGVFADTQHHQVEPLGQGRFVGARGGVAIGELALHAMHAFCRNRDAVEQRRFRHPIVTVGVISRHAALVTEKNIERRPIERQAGQRLVGGFWRGSAGQYQRSPTALVDGAGELGRDSLRGASRYIFRVTDDTFRFHPGGIIGALQDPRYGRSLSSWRNRLSPQVTCSSGVTGST